jgi:tRNA A-37 threonylcarbamoyl transferase component Bud32
MTENRRRPDDATQTVVLGPVASRPMAVLSAGTRLGERYEIRRVLGSGGFAVVYLARDLADGGEVALKVLRPDRVSDAALRRFRREAEIANAAASRHVVPVLDVGVAEGSPYLAMERVDGESLAQVLLRGALPVPRAVELAEQILRGLAALHEAGVLHRDVKPPNILLAADGTARLADFGLALSEQHAAETRATATEAVVGTVEYLSPEQALGEEVDARSDLYSFGVVLFEMLTGRLPHRAKSSLGTLVAHIQQPAPDVRRLEGGVPAWLAKVVARLLAKRPQDRYPSARSVLADLERRRATRPPGWRRRTWRRIGTSRRGRLVAAGALLLALLAVGAVWSVHHWRRQLNRLSQVGPDVLAVSRSGATLWRLSDRRGNYVVARLRPGEDARVVGLSRAWEALDETQRTLEIRGADDGALLETVTLPDVAGEFPGMADRYDGAVYADDLDDDGYAEILIHYHHQPYWPSCTLLYEPRLGRVRPVLIASGHHPYAGSVDLDGDGRRELLFAGIANRLGWHSGIAAVELDPPVNEEGVLTIAAQTPDRVPQVLQTPALLWYALLSRRALRISDNLTVDEAARRIVVHTVAGDRFVLGFDGFSPDEPSDLPGPQRNRLRLEAYRHLHEARRLAALTFADESIAEVRLARRQAQQVGDPHLAEWCGRVEVGVLIRLGRFDEAEALGESLLAGGTEEAEIGFDLGRPLLLAGQAERAVRWFRHGLGRDGDEFYGRGKYELLDGLIFSLEEAGRRDEARRDLERYAASSRGEQGGVFRETQLLGAYLDWRHDGGGPVPRLDAAASEFPNTDFTRYLACELSAAAREPADAVLAQVETELDRSSETLPLLLSLRAVLRGRQGRIGEAADDARTAWSRTVDQRPDNMYVRALTPLVAERYAALTGEPVPAVPTP